MKNGEILKTFIEALLRVSTKVELGTDKLNHYPVAIEKLKA
jgi:hypothetical protein